MKKINKIKIRVNGKLKYLSTDKKLSELLKNLKIPLKKVAVEHNGMIIPKANLKKKILKNNDKIEIVHFIGGG